MRHQDLEADNIRKLVQESAVVEGVDTRMEEFLQKVDRLVYGEFRKHRRLTGTQLRGLWNECMAMVRKDIVVIDGVFTEIPATLAKPKGEVYEMRFVSFMKMKKAPLGYVDIYQLFSFRLRLSRRSVEMDFHGHPAGFSYHATERVLERTKGTDEAMKRVATELAASLELIWAAAEHSLSACEGRLHIPFRDASGALLGEYVHSNDAHQYHRWLFTKGRARVGDLGERRNPAFFIALTFVDRYLFEPVQSYAMNLLSLWREEAGETYQNANSRRCWTLGQGLAVPGDIERDDDKWDMLRLVFADKAFRRAICRGRPEEASPADRMLPAGRWRVNEVEYSRPLSPPLPAAARLPEASAVSMMV